jgi:hypothetical protein
MAFKKPLAKCCYDWRKGIDVRVARLPTISVRPGLPNQAASSFASGIIREPLNGQASVCPVDGSTRLWLLIAAPGKSEVDLHDLPAGALGKKASTWVYRCPWTTWSQRESRQR